LLDEIPVAPAVKKDGTAKKGKKEKYGGEIT